MKLENGLIVSLNATVNILVVKIQYALEDKAGQIVEILFVASVGQRAVEMVDVCLHMTK